ncbi:MAG: histidine--tRNA ligase [Bacteroidetes bacterium]|nr:histidine--tRNA ligase [Bacteroidota bacterium]
MKPAIPSGTRDFSPWDVAKRNYIFSVLKETFERYGYQPIETPAMENLETLTGKYGEEGDKLIFRILNSGEFFIDFLDEYINKKYFSNRSRPVSFKESFSNITLDALKKYLNTYNIVLDVKLLSSELTKFVSEKALRYDLTVPFARYVVQHQHEITFPFKRYQMQPVWRADRPQKGRYREFYQCDVDVIGSNSLLNEVELLQMVNEIFGELLPAINFSIKINNRKILKGFAELIGLKDRLEELTNILDKSEKTGVEKTVEELREKNLAGESNIAQVKQYIEKNLTASGSNEKIKYLQELFTGSPDGVQGLQEIDFVLKYAENLNIPVALDMVLARGLNYYTGVICEVKPVAVTLSSSICGGGRYDDLTGIFGLPGVSGVGVSFGIERIIDVMNELNLFNKLSLTVSSSKVLFVNFGPAEEKFCLPLVSTVRSAGINAELYPDHAKIKKQFEYADKKKIPYVAIVGSEEMQSGMITLKEMKTGEQKKMTVEQMIQELKNSL